MASRRTGAGGTKLLSLPDDALGRLAGLLPQADRLNLAATCKALHSCCPRWFPEVSVRLPVDAPAVVPSLAAWLRRHPVDTRVSLTSRGAYGMLNRAAMSTARLSELAHAADAVPHIVSLDWARGSAEPLAALTALESLHTAELEGSIEPLWGLSRLTHMSLNGSTAAGSWSGLSRLTRLRYLSVDNHKKQQAVAAALPALGQLTSLAVYGRGPGSTAADWSTVSALTALHTLILECDQGGHVLKHLPASLGHLDFQARDLTTLPAQLSRCTALEHLELGQLPNGPNLAAHPLPGDCFSHLAPLSRLQTLLMGQCRIAPDQVPPGLTALTSLTRLHLDSTGITGGWHRLQGLPLQTLVISFTSFPHLPALPELTCLCLSSSIYPPPPAPTNAELSDCLAPKTKLRYLALHYCGLTAVPSVVSLLTRLTTLDLSGNHIAAGREHLGALTRLVHLHPRSDSEYSD